MNISFNKSKLTTVILAALTVSNAVKAEEIKESKKIEVIEVTAQKRQQSINEVPMAITAFDGKAMNERGISDTRDIAAIVPGLNFSESAFGSPVYTLRGVGFNETSVQATSTVGVYVDEAAIPFPVMTKGALLDVERIEVLKGPQGTLYGRNSTGGTINYITTKPTDWFEAGVKGQVANFGSKMMEGYISGPITDGFQARLAVKHENSSEGWQKSRTRNDELGKKDKSALRLSLHSDVTDSTTVDFSYNYWNDKSDNLAPQLVNAQFSKDNFIANAIRLGAVPDSLEPMPDDVTVADWAIGETPQSDYENDTSTLTIKTSLSDNIYFISLTSIANFTDNGSTIERSGIPGTSTAVAENVADIVGDAAFGLPPHIATFLSGYLITNTPEYLKNDFAMTQSTIDSLSQEFRFAGSHESVNWVAGVYYSKTEVDSTTTQIFEMNTAANLGPLPFLNFPSLDNKSAQESKSAAIFASADWEFDDLTITTGLRYSNDESEYKGCSADSGDGSAAALVNTGLIVAGLLPAPAGAVAGGCISLDANNKSGLYDGILDEDSLSWRFAANYQFNTETSIYGSYSRGFKAGSFPTLGAFQHTQLEPVVQEQVDALEVGFKATLDEGSAQLNGSVYYYDYQDKQMLTKIPDPIFGRLFALQNVDDSTVTGAELDLQWILGDHFTFTGSASYTKTEITEFEGTNQLGQVLDFSGSEFPFAANFQFSTSLNYENYVTESTFIFASVDYTFTSDANTDFEGTDSDGVHQYDDRFIIDSYGLLNARVGMSTDEGEWRAYLWVRNLTEEFYTNNVVMQIDMMARYVGTPRTFGITVEYNWQ